MIHDELCENDFLEERKWLMSDRLCILEMFVDGKKTNEKMPRVETSAPPLAPSG